MALDISDLPAPPKGVDISDLPSPPKAKTPKVEEKPFSMFNPPDPLQEAAGYKEAVKGGLSGVAQTATGLGELLPGEPGAISARGTQALQQIGAPEAQTAGQLLTPLPLSKLLSFGKATTAVPGLLSKGKQAFEAAKTGGKAGFIYGLASPTGKEDTQERYVEKGVKGLAGIPLGGLLGGGLGYYTATPLPSASDAARRYVKEFAQKGFKGGEAIESLAVAADNSSKEIERLTNELNSIQILKPDQITAKGEAAAQVRIDNLNRQLNTENEKILNLAKQKADALRLQGGAEAEKAANEVLSAAQAQINRSKQQVATINEKTQNRVNAAKSGIQKLGKEKELTDIFTPVQEKSIEKQNAFIAERDKLDKVLRDKQKDIVAANQAKGVQLENMPAYSEIDKLTRPFDPVTSPDIVKVTDPGVLSFYKRIRDSVINKRYELTKEQADTAKSLGYNVQEEGGRYYRIFKSSFEAADDARRFVGEVFRNPPEGYGAVKGIKQQNMYDLLSRLQQEYVGATEQKALQKNWADAARNLEQFETKAGRTLTEIEEGTSHTAKPPAELGNVFFTNRSGVQNLIDITGDASLVKRTAGEYLVNQFRGQNSGAVRTWLNQPKNRDWLSHPALADIKSQAEQYANALSSAERAQRATSKLAEAPIKVEGKRLPTTQAEQQALTKAEQAKATTLAPFEAKATAEEESARKLAEQAQTAVEQRQRGIVSEEKGKVRQQNIAAQQQYEQLKTKLDAAKGEANAIFSNAQKNSSVKESYDRLRRYANVVDQATAEAERTGAAPTTYNYESLVTAMKGFLNEQAKAGIIPPDLLIKESQKLDQINALMLRDKKIELLKEELKVLGGQVGTLNLRGALRTGVGILGRE
jgi:hypothetical protein